MNKNKKHFIVSTILVLIAVIYTILVKNIDVSSIGPKMSKVGFSTLNQFVSSRIGLNMFWYNLTKYLGVIPFLIVAFYGIQGLMQLIKTKSISKVDRKLLYLGGLYILLGITYILFEKVVINYRPVLLEGELEASYPSSHTMLALTICLSSLVISKDYIKNKTINIIFNTGTIVLMALLVIGRTLSGVHWISDIIGGIVISITLVSFFTCALQYTNKE